MPSEAETQLVKDLETLSLLDPDEATLRKQFELWDADGSGHIDFNELTIALHNFGFKHTPAEVNEILDKADADRSGHLSYAEFRRAFKTPSAAEKWVASMPVSRLIATQVCRGVQRLLGGNLLTYTHTHTHTHNARAHTHTQIPVDETDKANPLAGLVALARGPDARASLDRIIDEVTSALKELMWQRYI